MGRRFDAYKSVCGPHICGVKSICSTGNIETSEAISGKEVCGNFIYGSWTGSTIQNNYLAGEGIISYGGVPLALGQSDPAPAFNLGSTVVTSVSTQGLTAEDATIFGTLCATTIDATSAFVKVIDITQYELTGFDVNGDFTISGKLSANDGLSATGGNIYFSDNVGIGINRPTESLHLGDDCVLALGNDSDLSMWKCNADGASYIQGGTGGNLIIREPDGNIYLQGKSGEGGVAIRANSCVQLYYDASEKLKTQSTGVDVTGTITSDGHDIGGDLSVVGSISATKGLSAAAVAGTSYFGGNVGIGTNRPGSILELQGDGGNNKQLRLASGSSAVYWDIGRNFNTGHFEITEDSGSTYFLIDKDNGNVGIGTTAPNEKLTVAGTVSAHGGLSATGGFIYLQDNVGINAAGSADGAGLAPLVVRTKENNTEAVRIGNACGGGGSVKGKTLIGLHAWDTGTYPMVYIGAEEKDSADYCGDLFFSTRGAYSDSAPTERMRIKSAGNVGIGTSSPFGRLDVFSTRNAETGPSDASNYHLHLHNDGNDTDESIGIGFGITSTENCLGAAMGHERKGSSSYGDLYFSTRPDGGSVTERMRIDSTGNLGLGDTTPDAKLSIVGDVSATGGLSAAAVAGTSYFGGSVGMGTHRPGYPLHIIAPATASTSELIAQFQVSDDASSYVGIGNNNSGNNKLDPTVIGYNYCSNCIGLNLLGGLRADTTSSPAINIQGKIGGHAAGSAVAATTKLVCVNNYGTNPTVIMGNGNLGLGVTAPDEKLSVVGNISASGNYTSCCGTVNSKVVCGTSCVRGAYVCSTGNICAGSGIVYGGSCVCGPKVTDGYSCFDGSGNMCATNMIYSGDSGNGVCVPYGAVCSNCVNSNYVTTGTLSKSSGSFNINHPLESKKDTHRLVHSFIEGPQADNIYSGTVQLTAGAATVNIDSCAGMTEGTFAALNRCVRAFTTNETNWDPVKGSVSDNVLTVKSCVGDSTAQVSWMVLGERQDAHMKDPKNFLTNSEGQVIVEPEIE
jgi:hypothetical protein